jgi:hypothetical protein
MARRESLLVHIDALNAVDRELSEALQAFHDALDDDAQAGLFVQRVQYPFLARIMLNGQSRGPTDDGLGEDYAVAQGLPFGVILNNTCEVLDTVIGGRGATMPQAILGPGNSIGLFELIDLLAGEKRPRRPDWTIVAGSENLFTACPVDRHDFVERLRRSSTDWFDKGLYERQSGVADKVRLVSSVVESIQNWFVEVLYFNRAWFEKIAQVTADLPNIDTHDRLRATTRNLLHILYTRAWRSIASLRSSSFAMYNAFVPPDEPLPPNTVILATQAFQFFSLLVDVLGARRPSFIVDREDSDAGPYGTLCSKFLQVGGVERDLFFMRPAYLSPQQSVAFVPLETYLPRIFNGRVANREILEQLFDQIRNAYQRAIKKEQFARLPISRAPEILECLTFRTPMVGGVKIKKGKRANTCFRVKLHANFKISYPTISEQEFLSPQLQDLTATNAEFFRTCMRVQYTDMDG